MDAGSSCSTLNTSSPAAKDPEQPEARGLSGLVELFLKNGPLVDAHIRNPAREAELVPHFLAIALIGFSIYGVAMSVLLSFSPAPLLWVPAVRWANGSALSMILAYDLGMIAACGVCLPSFYFFGLLSGIRTTMLQVSLYALKGLAASSVVLVGILPIYVALAMGLVVFHAPQTIVKYAVAFGLLLPFVAGLWGVRSIFLGFMGLCDTLPEERRPSRECFLRRLIMAWAACYSAVTPVMIYTLWRQLSV